MLPQSQWIPFRVHLKLRKIEALLEGPEFLELRTTSREIHFYVETGDVLEDGFSRVLPYLCGGSGFLDSGIS
jgi:hypothetical protein